MLSSAVIKRVLVFCLLIWMILVFVGCTSIIREKVFVQPTVDVARINRLAVAPFEDKTRYRWLGDSIADSVISRLVPNVDFVVVERSQLRYVLDELRLNYIGVTDPNTAIRAAKVLGVDSIIIGTVTKCSISPVDVKKSRYDYKRRIQYYRAWKEAFITVQFRVIHAETAEIMYADDIRSTEWTSATFRRGESYHLKSNEKLLDELMRDASRRIAENFYPHYV